MFARFRFNPRTSLSWTFRSTPAPSLPGFVRSTGSPSAEAQGTTRHEVMLWRREVGQGRSSPLADGLRAHGSSRSDRLDSQRTRLAGGPPPLASRFLPRV